MKRLSIHLMALLSLGFLGLAAPSASAAVVPVGAAIIGAEGAGVSTELVQYYEEYRPRRYYGERRYGPPPATRPCYGPVPWGEAYDPCKKRIQQWNGYRYIVRRIRVC